MTVNVTIKLFLCVLFKSISTISESEKLIDTNIIYDIFDKIYVNWSKMLPELHFGQVLLCTAFAFKEAATIQCRKIKYVKDYRIIIEAAGELLLLVLGNQRNGQLKKL